MTCYLGDCRDGMREMIADGVRVQMCVTSPPFWGLRDYGTATWDGGDAECDHTAMRQGYKDGDKNATNVGASRDPIRGGSCRLCGARRVDQQIGLEATPGAYVASMVEVFRLVRELLADDGTLWLNLGSSYANVSGGAISAPEQTKNLASPRMRDMSRFVGFKPKDMVPIPWMVAMALQADGWVLRQEIVWAKPNPMPESVTDRCTKSHESLFLFAKAKWIGVPSGRFSHISDENARWLALCIDTEGCIVVKRVRQNDGGADAFGPQVTFGGTSRALVNRFREIVGHGNIAVRSGKNAPMNYWQLDNNIARDFLHRIYPFLIVKQRQARIGIHVDDLVYYRGGKLPSRKNRTPAENNRLMSLWARGKLCNKFGDPDLSDVPEPQYGRWDSQPYYFDATAIAETSSYPGDHRALRTDIRKGVDPMCMDNGRRFRTGNPTGETRNRRSVWTVASQPFVDAHFAVFPPKLIEPCILAGSRVGDIVFDPFLGSGTTAMVAQQLGRRWLGCELNSSYLAMQERRTAQQGIAFA